MDPIIINPIISIRFLGGKYILSHPEKKKQFEISKEVIDILFHIHSNRHTNNLEELIAKQFDVSREISKETIIKLCENGILLKEKKASELYKTWITNGWRHALVFHEATKNLSFADEHPQKAEKQRLKLTTKYSKEEIPDLSKVIGTYIDLPPPTLLDASLGKVLRKRRTYRAFGENAITISKISNILYYGTCEIATRRSQIRNNISEDPRWLLYSTYIPFEVYFVALNISNFQQGIYHYQLEKHQSSLIRSGNFCKEISSVAIGQNVSQCSTIFIITACFKRYMYRYRHSRALRNLFIESGSLCHKLLITAEALGLRTFLTPALRDVLAEKLFELKPGYEYPLYLLAVGYGKTKNNVLDKKH